VVAVSLGRPLEGGGNDGVSLIEGHAAHFGAASDGSWALRKPFQQLS
jgi:hypothetical protein